MQTWRYNQFFKEKIGYKYDINIEKLYINIIMLCINTCKRYKYDIIWCTDKTKLKNLEYQIVVHTK